MTQPSANLVAYLELQTNDLPRACAFYMSLFGWHAETIRIGRNSYLTLDLGARIEGGVVEREMDGSLWLPYVEVADIMEANERAHGLGAHVALPPREGPAGWRSILETPAGAEIALWQPKR
ncbi:MAG TPA: VOC family protein [Gaiellaceae bacterium]|nr:VOC family protein [Gaiellaceae bacterium]